MGTIAEKLAKTEQTKGEIKTAINNTGCPAVQASDTFASYATKIRDYLVYPQNTLPITQNDTYDVTNYKYVNVNVPIKIYETTKSGSGNNTIAFTGVPKEPFAFFISAESSISLSRDRTLIIDIHYHTEDSSNGGTIEWCGATLTGGNAGTASAGTGTYTYNNGTLNITAAAAGGTTPQFVSGCTYELVCLYTLL